MTGAPPPRFAGHSIPRVIDQNSADDLGSDGVKMRAITPLYTRLIHQTQIRLIHQGRGLKRMAGPFAAHVAVCDLVQFPFGQGQWRAIQASARRAPDSMGRRSSATAVEKLQLKSLSFNTRVAENESSAARQNDSSQMPVKRAYPKVRSD
jgi:hypothetical protein